jgi:hypothetical protein
MLNWMSSRDCPTPIVIDTRLGVATYDVVTSFGDDFGVSCGESVADNRPHIGLGRGILRDSMDWRI